MASEVTVARRRGSLWTETVPLLVIATVVLVTVVGAFVADPDSGQLGGDFPSFYAAGSIVVNDGYESLYDPATQRAAQDGLIAADGGYLFFAYPPPVAASYSVAARLGYRTAYALQVLVMAAAAVGAVYLLRPLNNWLDSNWRIVAAAAVMFHPLLVSITGGQNTAFTLWLLAVAARGEHDGHDLLAGVAIGLMAYKPQYGVALAAVVFLSGRLRMIAGVGAAWIAFYLVGVAAMGWGWPLTWWDQAGAFRDLNATVNGPLFVSLPGVAEHLTGIGGGTGQALAGVGLALGVMAAAWLWRQSGVSLAVRWAFTAGVLVLAAPQSLFYEAGVLMLMAALLVRGSRRSVILASAVWIAGWLYPVTAAWGNTSVLVIALTLAVILAVMVGMDQSKRAPVVTR